MDRYIELVKKTVNNSLYLGTDSPACEERYYAENEWKLPRSVVPHTLCNRQQLDFLHRLMVHLHANDVQGDFLEAGVWRGGACILMRAFIETIPGERSVWLLDTFEGIPVSEPSSYVDEVDAWQDRWTAGLQEVRENFAAYGLLDARVKFVPGRIKESAPKMHQQTFALARLDVDSYASYIEALEALLPRMTKGGCIVIDDWHLEPCREAVNDFRTAHGIRSPIAETFGGAWADAHWFVQE
ncbi:TylF/MycF/NovP-related O-methyltransferase [Roseateles sp. MS654]|uniref:TylF/MycF/NovP-related O-methyltransferase n=1 Tax=Roseateles sp. MS654 TaxID=3412685 RepID=UPI003C304A84